MIIIELNGGLGNQLQQYALYEKMRSLGKEVKLDTSWYTHKEGEKEAGVTQRGLELDYFPKVSYETCTRQEKEGILGRENLLRRAGRKLGISFFGSLDNGRYVEHQMYDEALFLLENKVLSGYWACEAYYQDILPLLREKLRFPPSGDSRNERMKKEMEESNSVSIHLRRGDYLTPENQRIFGGICTDAYYASAIEYIRKTVDDPRFFIFSDDLEYACGQFEGTLVDINRGSRSFYDLELMSVCKHNICANSTFSFWGARLNSNPQKKVIRPLKQKNGVDWYHPKEMERLWRGWICVDERGEYV